MVNKESFEEIVGRPQKIGNYHRQDKLLELLLEFNPNNELAKRVYDDGYHYENDKQFIQEDIQDLKEFINRANNILDNYYKMYPGKTNLK